MKKKWLLPLFLILMLTLAACGTDPDPDTPADDEGVEDTPMDPTPDVDEDADDNQNTDDDSNQDANAGEIKYEDIKLTPEDAFDKFMEAHPDSKVTEIDLDKNLTNYQYKVEGYDNDNNYEVKINPVNGDIISDDKELIDLDDDDKGEITKDDVGKIKIFVDKAMTEAGYSSSVNEWSLDIDDGKKIFDIEIKKDNNDVEYTYDLESEELIEKD